MPVLSPGSVIEFSIDCPIFASLSVPIASQDTVILIDMRLYYEGKKVWGHPEVFRPERFINQAGEIVNTKNIISFSFSNYGEENFFRKRACPGEIHSKFVSFSLLTLMLQRYKISSLEGEPKPRLDLRLGFSIKPYPFKAVFTQRILQQ
ncbi:Cytochrome P450 2U1 [Folsomia candida]|uniref:Cytochrome P450 2U1 n=1 Tax=Folsomia candida TaxID=158441 RepID=A0A226DQP7_FOLCA|nr:Cytochrome P450 2U1 [Folsomia candida]